MSGSEQAFNVAIGHVLRVIRRSRKLSISKLCELSGGGIKKAAYGTYERGERAMTVVRLDTIANLLGTTVHEVMTRAAVLHRTTQTPDHVGNVTVNVESLCLSDREDMRLIARWLAMTGLLVGKTVTITPPMLDSLSSRLCQPACDLRKHLERLH